MSEAAAGTAASTRTTTDTATAAAAAATTTAAAAARYAAGRAFFDSQPQDLPAAKVELEAAYEAAYFRVYDAHAPTAAAPAVDSPAAAAAARQLVDIAWYLAQTYVRARESGGACACVHKTLVAGGIVVLALELCHLAIGLELEFGPGYGIGSRAGVAGVGLTLWDGGFFANGVGLGIRVGVATGTWEKAIDLILRCDRLHCLDEHAPALPCLELCCGLLIAIPNYAPSELAECFIYKVSIFAPKFLPRRALKLFLPIAQNASAIPVLSPR